MFHECYEKQLRKIYSIFVQNEITFYEIKNITSKFLKCSLNFHITRIIPQND